jgi:hypothetical protein
VLSPASAEHSSGSVMTIPVDFTLRSVSSQRNHRLGFRQAFCRSPRTVRESHSIIRTDAHPRSVSCPSGGIHPATTSSGKRRMLHRGLGQRAAQRPSRPITRAKSPQVVAAPNEHAHLARDPNLRYNGSLETQRGTDHRGHRQHRGRPAWLRQRKWCGTAPGDGMEPGATGPYKGSGGWRWSGLP